MMKPSECNDQIIAKKRRLSKDATGKILSSGRSGNAN